ncbi:mitotic interactor and substrate of PLK1 [Takifugu rubripes]|uniref:mitotic interactor and substrate of PLK1 n=1 Tax=Takifugu rubripes TaxID=31033 RepID=UPI0011456AAF|nr:mitotic interactor and substrate of PLK1 [Takifugu rubripes]XP_029684017.1 mitotic interactor and substrate of PLK1 [Takifugu rubripes]
MDTPPRRWVLKPLSPVLQPSDLRTLSTGPDSSLDHLGFSAGGSSEVASSQQDPSSPEVVFQARHITVYQDAVNTSEECPPSNPSSPSSSSSGSQCGFYSFVEDPTSPEAELNEAWMVSPQRHAQLATLKMEKGFKLQTYANYRKPQSLFSESNGDSQYRVDRYAGVEALQEEEDKHLRKEIIRNQAPKRSLRPLEGSGVTSRTQQLSPAEPSTIDRESISFTAARQQFLKFEQDRKTSLLSPVSFCTTYVSPPPQPKENQENSAQAEEPRCQQSNVVDGPDSGLKGLSMEAEGDSSSTGRAGAGGLTAKYETPIEREIRLSQEREENLRRSRGLKISTEEIVEIKTKRLQSPLTPTKALPGLHQGVQVLQGHDKPELNEQKQQDLDPGDPESRVDLNAEDKRRGEGAQSGDTTDVSSPCCPHLHTEDTEFNIRVSDTRSVPEVQDTRSFHPGSVASHSSSPPMQAMDTPLSWREHLQLNGLQSRNAGAPNFIEQEIEEVLKREEELQELRDSSPPQVFSPAPLVNPRITEGHLQPTGQVTLSASHRPPKRMSSISLITAQPWTSSPPTATSIGGVRPAPPPVGGLTDTLLQDFEERRAQQKLEETSYAGILRLDHVNHEVVESTRVARHKNQRALLWEAGVFANQADQ